MKPDEFNQFKNRLFVMYPGLQAWLHEHSPDMIETMQSWCRRLERYTAAECYGVLAAWEKSNDSPFKAYERDQLPAIVASIINKQRDAEAKRRETQSNRTQYEGTRQERAERMSSGTVLDSEMRKAVELGQPIHKRFLDGEITRDEYERQRDAIIDRCLGGKDEFEQIGGEGQATERSLVGGLADG